MSTVPTSSVAGGDDVITAVDADAAHQWFTALDERSFVVGAKRWLTHVVGIHPDRRDLWIQVELVGEQRHSFVIRVNPASTVNEAIGAVEALVRDAVGPMACGNAAPRPGDDVARPGESACLPTPGAFKLHFQPARLFPGLAELPQ